MTEEQAFVRAIQADPDDATLRMVYADWLEERGDPRGEYLRLSSELASSSQKTPSRRGRKARAPRADLWSRLQRLRPAINREWLASIGCLFHFHCATSASERLDELEFFLEFWYGSRNPEFGESEDRLKKLALPYPLRRFYAFAGRWPSPRPSYPNHLFYTGTGHHLHDLDSVDVLPDGKLNFFMEYQGDWDGLTLPVSDDPPVWIEGALGEDGERGTKQVSDSLSKFLVTHCLMTTIYDSENSPCSRWDEKLGNWFQRTERKPVRIWSSLDCSCPEYDGTFFLFHESVLVLQIGSSFKIGAIQQAGIDLIRHHMKD
jgi:uncharacterized protein (TIGR02996 family)